MNPSQNLELPRPPVDSLGEITETPENLSNSQQNPTAQNLHEILENPHENPDLNPDETQEFAILDQFAESLGR